MTWETHKFKTEPFPRWISAGGQTAHYFFGSTERGLSLCGVEYHVKLFDLDPEFKRPHCKKCTRLYNEDIAISQHEGSA